jgi:hypothetical protein
MKRINILAIAAILLLIIFLIICFYKSGVIGFNLNGNQTSEEKTNLNKSNGDYGNKINNQGEGSSAIDRIGGLMQNENLNVNNFTNLPGDADILECGIYFEKYGICKGKCPSGECKIEGRSCYCRNI